MRIRRYAARLLANSATAPSSSPPPHPAAPWFHHAATDDCAICELARSAPEVAPDAIKPKAHIVCGVPGAELRSDERVVLPQTPPVPEAQGCKIYAESPVDEAAERLQVTRGLSAVSGAAARPECTGEAVLVTEPADTGGAFIVNEATVEQEVRGEASLASEAATEPADTGGGFIVNEASLASEAATEPADTGGGFIVTGEQEEASLVNEPATEQEVTEGASLVNGLIVEPEVTEGAASLVNGLIVEPEVTEGAASLVNRLIVEPEVTERPASLVNGLIVHPDDLMEGSLANEAVTVPGVSDRVSIVAEDATGPTAVLTVPEVTKGAPLRAEHSAEPEATAGASLVNGLIVEPKVLREDSLANEAVTEPEVSDKVSLASEAATEPAATVIVPEVRKGAHLDAEGSEEPEVNRGASPVKESAAEVEVITVASLVDKTEPEVTGTVLEVTGVASLDKEVAVEPEDTRGSSLINEATELEIPEGAYSAKEATLEPEVIGGASSRTGNGDAASNEPRSPYCNTEISCTLFSCVQVENAGETSASTVQPSRDGPAEADNSVNFKDNGPVRDESTAEEVALLDECMDTPSVSCVSDIVTRSVGKSGRTDIICYARRRGKRKLEIKEEEIEIDYGAISDQCNDKATLERTGACESAMSTAGSAEIKIADIKRGLLDNSASSKGKKRKTHRFECDIDYCHMTFKKRSELSVHKKNICIVKSCNRHFRSHTYLRRHQGIHNDYCPYKCPWEGCDMAFKWTSDLAEHFKVHIGERPYKCTTPGCGKIYKYVSDFTRHWKRCKPER